MNYFRYRTSLSPQGVSIIEERFFTVRETECFAWVAPETWRGMGQQWLEENARKIRKDALVTYCYADKAEALRSFKARQEHRVRHAKNSLRQAELALAAIEGLDHIENGHPCGQDAYTSNLRWIEY